MLLSLPSSSLGTKKLTECPSGEVDTWYLRKTLHTFRGVPAARIAPFTADALQLTTLNTSIFEEAAQFAGKEPPLVIHLMYNYNGVQ